MNIYTIGHSRHAWEVFAALLRDHGIQTLVDVRSNPVSRFAPFANRRRLPELLEAVGVSCLYMGDVLGGKPADPSMSDDDGRPDYAKMQALPAFQKGIDELIGLAESSAVAIMCAEEDPAKCHRRLLIGSELESRGVDVLHIRKDGSVSTSEALAAVKPKRSSLQRVLPLGNG